MILEPSSLLRSSLSNLPMPWTIRRAVLGFRQNLAALGHLALQREVVRDLLSVPGMGLELGVQQVSAVFIFLLDVQVDFGTRDDDHCAGHGMLLSFCQRGVEARMGLEFVPVCGKSCVTLLMLSSSLSLAPLFAAPLPAGGFDSLCSVSFFSPCSVGGCAGGGSGADEDAAAAAAAAPAASSCCSASSAARSSASALASYEARLNTASSSLESIAWATLRFLRLLLRLILLVEVGQFFDLSCRSHRLEGALSERQQCW
jgi:hypothetical protein